jgi:hypothetical protein
MPRVIVKFLDGDVKEGDVLYFNVNQKTFPLQINDGETKVLNINLDSVKSVHFLKKKTHDSLLIKEKIDKSIYAGTMANKLVVEFKDGEIVHGSTLKYNPNDKGFFLVPLNPGDISERIYVNAQAVKYVDQKKLLGKVLVDHQKITTNQLEYALQKQRELREKRIGTILKENNYITEEQLKESLKKQEQKNKLLGEILLEAGYISEEQLKTALKIQQENRSKKLGQILVELKYVTPNDICIALATQFNKPWIDMSLIKIPHEVATILPEDIVRRYEIIPIEIQDDGKVLIATSQPQDNTIEEELRRLNINFELVIAYEGFIDSAIQLHFPIKE